MSTPIRIIQAIGTALCLMPRWHFDRSLYEKLVRERQINGDKITAPQTEPQVDFTMGPIDGILGYYNKETNIISVDLLEHMFALLMENTCPADLKRKFDERVTRTLAHEGGHWHLQKIHGRYAHNERKAMLFVFGLLGILSGLGFTFGIGQLCLRVVVPLALHSVGSWPGLALAIGSILVGLWLSIKVNAFVAHSWHFLAWATTYKLCYTERFARQFETRPAHDPRWDDVIKVD